MDRWAFPSLSVFFFPRRISRQIVSLSPFFTSSLLSAFPFWLFSLLLFRFCSFFQRQIWALKEFSSVHWAPFTFPHHQAFSSLVFCWRVLRFSLSCLKSQKFFGGIKECFHHHFLFSWNDLRVNRGLLPSWHLLQGLFSWRGPLRKSNVWSYISDEVTLRWCSFFLWVFPRFIFPWFRHRIRE